MTVTNDLGQNVEGSGPGLILDTFTKPVFLKALRKLPESGYPVSEPSFEPGTS
jgi:hypothetical protein